MLVRPVVDLFDLVFILGDVMGRGRQSAAASAGTNLGQSASKRIGRNEGRGR